MILKDQTVIITGAARGIGKGIALTLAREGAAIVVADRNAEGAEHTAGEIRAAGGAAKGVAVDVTNRDDVHRLMQTAVAEFGRVDVLVNNAGVVSNTPILDLSEPEWDLTLAVNLKGVFLCSQSAARIMAARRSGRIINISSLSGKVGAPGQAAYCASKHAVLGLTKVMAIDLAPYGINVNAICPGNTETEMMLSLIHI